MFINPSPINTVYENKISKIITLVCLLIIYIYFFFKNYLG